LHLTWQSMAIQLLKPLHRSDLYWCEAGLFYAKLYSANLGTFVGIISRILVVPGAYQNSGSLDAPIKAFHHEIK
jgi:hypothetical protein